MERHPNILAARGITDSRDRLLTADEPLADLQENCGGLVPGPLAIPELRELVRQGREMGLRLSREFSAFDGVDLVSGIARIHPLDAREGGGCEILIESWQLSPMQSSTSRETSVLLDDIDRASAEISGRLDAQQKVQLLNVDAPDAKDVEQAFTQKPGLVWTDYVSLRGVAHQQPLHWRLLDGADCEVPGSPRKWRVRLLPIGADATSPNGFELLLVADQPLPTQAQIDDLDQATHSQLVGSALTPVLRQPIARIIANAETIRAKLAGPLRDEYSEYAGNIAAAGQHLSGMLDDLADLEVVEAEGFVTLQEKVNLADVARRAGGILGVRAQARSITLSLPDEAEKLIAKAEFRRVLQILINLIGNAIAYSNEGTEVTVSLSKLGDDTAVLKVTDQGDGISEEQAETIFDKFERLGRDSDGGNDTGSGLGLYISRRLARAMGGNLEVDLKREGMKAPGATFVLTLPLFNK